MFPHPIPPNLLYLPFEFRSLTTDVIQEIPAARIRPLQMGMATASQWLFNFVVAKGTLSMFATMGNNGFGTYLLYGSFCFGMTVFAWFFVPETKGK